MTHYLLDLAVLHEHVRVVLSQSRKSTHRVPDYHQLVVQCQLHKELESLTEPSLDLCLVRVTTQTTEQQDRTLPLTRITTLQ